MSFRSLALLLCFGFPSFVLASDYTSPRAASLGGAGHAAPILNDALYMNPAMIALLPAYSISLSHESAKGPDDTEPKALVQNASIQDGTNPFFAAGVGYTRLTYGQTAHVGVASRFLQSVGVGMGGKFFWGSDSRDAAQDTMLSTVASPIPWLQGSVIVDNLFESSKIKAWNRYREFTAGLKADFQKIMMVYIDPHFTPGKPGESFGYQAGIELPIMSDLFVRAGLNRNSFQPALGIYGRGHGFGLGWALPRFSVDVALTRTMEPVRTNNILFSFTVL